MCFAPSCIWKINLGRFLSFSHYACNYYLACLLFGVFFLCGISDFVSCHCFLLVLRKTRGGKDHCDLYGLCLCFSTLFSFCSATVPLKCYSS